MSLIVHEIALQVVTELAPLVPRIARHDRNLAQQLRRAASSMVLNIAEGEHPDPGTRRARFHSAAGSANETRAAIRVARAWRYLGAEQVEPCLAGLDLSGGDAVPPDPLRLLKLLRSLLRGAGATHGTAKVAVKRESHRGRADPGVGALRP